MLQMNFLLNNLLDHVKFAPGIKNISFDFTHSWMSVSTVYLESTEYTVQTDILGKYTVLTVVTHILRKYRVYNATKINILNNFYDILGQGLIKILLLEAL